MTSGRTSIAAGAVAAAGATVAVFAAANMVGHSLGYDLWPMFDGNGSRVIEVPAASPNGPGVNPLLPSASALTRHAGGHSTSPGVVVFGPGLPRAAAVPAAGTDVGALPRTSARRPGAAHTQRSTRRSSSRRTSSTSRRAPTSSAPAAPRVPQPVAPSVPQVTGTVKIAGKPSGKSQESDAGNGNSQGNANKILKSGSANGNGNGNGKKAAAAAPPSPGQAKSSSASVAAPAELSRSGSQGDGNAQGNGNGQANGNGNQDASNQGISGSPAAPPAPGQAKGGD
jgi:hypothetical protein